MNKRLDHLLFEKGLARTRSHAQRLIKDGFVKIDSSLVNQVSIFFPEDMDLKRIEVAAEARYVSRGALKMLGALDRLKISVTGFTCLDLGVSTGGFSQVLLERGARSVVGVDVGQNQISPELKNESRLRVLEKTNARDLTLEMVGGEPFDFVVMDVAFISITLILPRLRQLLKPTGACLSLVKPQFELGKESLNKQGVVKDPALYDKLEQRIRLGFSDSGFKVGDYFPSEIKGADGNAEFFCYGLVNS